MTAAPTASGGNSRLGTAVRAARRLVFYPAAALALPTLSAGVGLAVMLVVVAALGFPPGVVAPAFIGAVMGDAERLSATLLLACPLMIIGTGLALSFRCGVWNIGADGQYLVGALAGAATAPYVGGWPSAAALGACLLAGVAAGGLWAAVAALLQYSRGVPDVLATILLNFVAIQVLSIVVRGPLADPLSADRDTTAAIPAAAEIPLLYGPGGLHAGIALAVFLAAMLSVFLSRTTWGLRTRIVGLNPIAARFARIPVAAYACGAFVASGAMGGLAGAVEVCGNTHYLTGAYSAGYGYTAIAVALLAGLRPLGVIPAALFFAALESGSRGMQKMPQAGLQDFPTVLTFAAQGVVLLVSVLAARRALERREAA